MEMSFHGLHRIRKNDTELGLWTINQSNFIEEFRRVTDISMLFCILGLFGNGFLGWLLCCTITKSRFMVYIVNLAVSDFIILLHYFVTYLLFLLPSHVSFHSQHVQVVSLIFGSGTDLLFLTAISAERYIMVSSSFCFHYHRPQYLTAIVCVGLWTLSIVLTMLKYFLCHPRYLTIQSDLIGFLYCHTAIVLQYIINYLVFFPVMVFCTLSLLIKMLKNPQQDFPARLDASIMATVFLHVMLSVIIKLIVFINYLVAFVPSSHYRNVSLILDCVDSIVNPFVYLLVGCWKEKSLEPLHVLIERGLSYTPNSLLRRPPDQEQVGMHLEHHTSIGKDNT